MRLFDFLVYQQERFSKDDMLAAKENGNWRKYSTAETLSLTQKLAAGLRKLGVAGNDMQVENQDKVAIISRNRPEWLMLDMACQMTGAIICPVYPTTNPSELEFIFNDAGVKYVFISGEDIREKVDSIKNNVPSLKEVYSFDDMPGCVHWHKLLNVSGYEVEDGIRHSNSVNADHCATIIYTSGTTGKPKGVMLSHRNIVSNVLNSIKSFPFQEAPAARSLSFLPLNHIFERMVSYIYIYSGISIYYAESMETIGENLKEVKPMVFCTVPRLLEKVYDKIIAKGSDLKGFKKKLFFWSVNLGNRYSNREDLGPLYRMQLAIANKLVFSKWREALGNNIQYIITGGAACQVRLLRIFNAAKIPIYEGYGPTENSPVISVNRRGKDGSKYGTVGPILGGQDVKLMEDGEICVKGPSVMMGYYKRPDLTTETIIDGWLHTGDIGVMDEGKFLKITDRKKELFKTSGGKYVAPQPIENKLKESIFIEQVMVVGADEKFVGALIVPSKAAIENWLNEKGLEYTYARALDSDEVKSLFRHIIDGFNREFNHVEQVKKFELVENEWTIETGELTPTLKLKRKFIMEKYASTVNQIYR